MGTGDEVRAWLRGALPAGWVEAVDAGDEDALAAARRGFDRDAWLRTLGAQGWMLPQWPAEHGGAGLPLDEARAIHDVLRHYRVPRTPIGAGLDLAAPTIGRWAPEDTKVRFLTGIARGEEVWCQLFSEPGSGSDLASLGTRAVRDGDEWVVNGQKVWTTFGHLAHFGLLLARTDPDAPKHKGITYFALPMHAPGVEVRPLVQMTGDAEFNEVFMTDVRIPDLYRLSRVGEGWAASQTTLANERAALSGGGGDPGSGNSALLLGGMSAQALLDLARATGTSADPVRRDALMRLWIEARVLQLTNRRAGAARAAGRSPGPESSIGKLFKSEHNQRLQAFAVGLAGMASTAWDGTGPRDFDAAGARTTRGFLRSRANTIEGGTAEVLRNILGERVLGLPREPQVDRDVPWSQTLRN